MKEFYTLEEVARLLGMSWSWIDKKIREQKIEVIWLGGSRKIPKREVDRIKRDGVR